MDSSTLKELNLLSRRGFEFINQGFNMYFKIIRFWMDYANFLKMYQDVSKTFYETLSKQTELCTPAYFPRLQQEQFNAIARSWTDYIKEMSKAVSPGME